MSFWARYGGGRGSACRFRAIAHNGDLPSGGTHPFADSSRVTVAETGRITSKEWRWVILPPWCAPRDFSRFAIAGFTEGLEAMGDVSNVCVREIDDCDSLVFGSGGGPTFELGPNVTLDMANSPTAQLVTSNLGSMSDLYGERFGPNGEDRWFGHCTDCVSLGGWIPEDYLDHVPWYDPDAEAIDLDDVDNLTAKFIAEMNTPGFAPGLKPIALKLDDCRNHDPAPRPHDERRPNNEPPVPFSGRDIVFVHGFQLDHVLGRIVADTPTLLAGYNLVNPSTPPAGAITNAPREWPDVPEAYAPNGYFRSSAENDYWAQHIAKHLAKQPNRYIVTGFNCSQRLVYAVHAVLAQIADAMMTGNGVRQDGRSAADTGCFGKELVIITHSTGAAVVAVAMGIAAMTAHDQGLQAIYGDVSEIARRTKVHVSMHGALAGSEIATAALAGAIAIEAMASINAATADVAIAKLRLLAAAGLDPAGKASTDDFLDLAQSTNDRLEAAVKTAPRTVYASILVDLVPQVMQDVWSPIMQKTETDTLTVGGGHPTFFNKEVAAKPLLTAIDDGVVNLNSQSGALGFMPHQYAYQPPLTRIYDMGISVVRAASFLLAQTTLTPGTAAFGSSPYVSPTGMQQPVRTVLNANRLPRVHPFLQSTSDHGYTTPNNNVAPPPPGQYIPATPDGRNYEETLVIESSVPYTSGLVDRAIEGDVRLYERRLDLTITFTIMMPRISIFPPSFELVPITISLESITVWRRFYQLLGDLDNSIVLDPSTVNVSATVAPGGGSLTIDFGSVNPDPLEVAMINKLDDENSYVYRYVLPA